MKSYEAKVKTKALVGTPWEDILVTHTFYCRPDDLGASIADLMSDDVHEIRTNRQGYFQGAYHPHPSRCFEFVTYPVTLGAA